MDDFKRVFRLSRPSAADARKAVAEELEFHLEETVEELVEEGWSRKEAEAEARRQFGDLEHTERYCAEMHTRREREERRAMTMDGLWQDLRYAFRTLRGAPGYAGLVVLTLAFGIAANTTIFSVMNPYFFRPLPYGEPDELVHITQVDPVSGWHRDRISIPIYEDWKEGTRTLDDLAAYTYGGVVVTGPEGPEGVNASWVTANMFEVLQSDALLGRTFLEDEGGPAGEKVVILDHGFWERRYARDRDVLGRTLTLDGIQHTVVGVVEGVQHAELGGGDGARAQLYLPALQGSLRRQFFVIRAADEPTALTRPVRQALLALDPDLPVSIRPMSDVVAENQLQWSIGSVTLGVFGGGALLLAALGVYGLISFSVAQRRRELGVRMALGASRKEIRKVVVGDGLRLTVVGLAAGLALTLAMGRLIASALYGVTAYDPVTLGGVLLLFLGVAALASLVPAERASRTDPAGTLRAE